LQPNLLIRPLDKLIITKLVADSGVLNQATYYDLRIAAYRKRSAHRALSLGQAHAHPANPLLPSGPQKDAHIRAKAFAEHVALWQLNFNCM
jgi:hypothetical protein